MLIKIAAQPRQLAAHARARTAGPDAVAAPKPPPSKGRTFITTTRGIITMTSTQESTRPILLIGQAVGQAEARGIPARPTATEDTR